MRGTRHTGAGNHTSAARVLPGVVLMGKELGSVMTYMAVAGIALILVLAVVVGIVEARTSAHWRQVAAERRRSWESAHLRDDYPTGPHPLVGSR